MANRNYRQKSRRRYKRKSHRFRNFIIFVLIAAIISGVIWFLSGNYKKAEHALGKTIYPIKYSEYVDKASEDYNLDKALIYAVIRTESKFDPNCESNVGAVGLMQMMPESFRWVQKLRKTSLDEDELSAPSVNIDYGCYLLKYFLKHYKNERCAIAAYNAGFVVTRWLKDSRYSSDGKTLKKIPYDETAKYVKRVEHAKNMYNKIYFT